MIGPQYPRSDEKLIERLLYRQTTERVRSGGSPELARNVPGHREDVLIDPNGKNLNILFSSSHVAEDAILAKFWLVFTKLVSV